MSFITDPKALKYVKSLQSTRKKINFEKEFPYTTKGITQIIGDMLEFNPYFRNSASEILKHKIFDGCRKKYPDSEVEAEWKIQLVCDEKGSFDYEKCTTKLSIDDMKKIFVDEIDQLKRMNLLQN